MAFTYFFRDLHTMELLVDEFLKTISGRININIWDAGCASGQEPFTLAILLAEKMGQYTFKNVSIYATDIDISNSFQDKIVNGIYDYCDVQRVPNTILSKYFKEIGPKKYQINYEIRNRMKFLKHDLLSLSPVRNDFSLILCKNVLLHFNEKERIQVLEMYHKSLLADGLIAMEHTQKIPEMLSGIFSKKYSNAQIFKKIS